MINANTTFLRQSYRVLVIMYRRYNGTIGLYRHYCRTHFRCTSRGNPSFSIRSASSSNVFFSSSFIRSKIFFVAVVRSWNHPGVLVSAETMFRMDAISLKTSSGRVHHRISVNRYRIPFAGIGFFFTRQTFRSHRKRHYNKSRKMEFILLYYDSPRTFCCVLQDLGLFQYSTSN